MPNVVIEITNNGESPVIISDVDSALSLSVAAGTTTSFSLDEAEYGRIITAVEDAATQLLLPGGGPRIAYTVDDPRVSVGDGVAWSGWADYNNSGGVLVLNADEWVTLPNDGAGPFSNSNYIPEHIERLIDPATGYLDFSDLVLGDEVMIRQDISVTPSTNGAEIDLRVLLGTGAAQYPLTYQVSVLSLGAGIEYPLVQNLMLYMGDENTRGGVGILQVRCSENATAVNNGSYVSVRGIQ